MTSSQRWARAVGGAALVLALCPLRSSAICRVVEPARGSEDPGVPFDPRTVALFALSPDVIVDYTCPSPDGAIIPDAGDGGAGEPLDARDADAGEPLDARDADAGEPLDAGDADDSGEALDAGVALDAGPRDPAVCPDGQRARPVRDTLISLVVQPSILASGGTAGLVMPVPARPDVAIGSTAIFDAASALMTPMIHETVHVTEDPSLGFQCTDPHYYSALDPLLDVAAAPLALYGCGGTSSDFYRPGTEGREPEVVVYGDAGVVRYESFPTTDAYDVTVLSASSLAALGAWLDEHGFAHDAHDDEAFGAYVGTGAWFVALHVHPPSSHLEPLALEPLVVTWRGTEIPITNRLQYEPDGGWVTTDAFVVAPARMDVSEGRAFTEYAAPADFRRTPLSGFGLSGGWLTRLTISRQTSVRVDDDRLVEVVDAQQVTTTVERSVRARIAAPCCRGSNLTTTDPAAFRTYTYRRTYRAGESPSIPEAWLGATEPLTGSWCTERSYSSSSSSGYCSAAGAAIGGWGPIALAVALVVLRRRRA